MIDLLATSMTTPVGLSPLGTAAAIRGGITRAQESSVINKRWKPQVMSLVAEEYLPPLDPKLAPTPMTSANQRMLRLAGPALAEICAAAGAPVPLLLALPEPRSEEEDAVHPKVLSQLAAQSGAAIDAKQSKLYRQGGAGGLYALRDAFEMITTNAATQVIVGGADTFLDLRRLATLDAEDRLHGSMDGFIPGEGAAFLLLAAPKSKRALAPIARVTSVGVGAEPGHRYSKDPYRGEGLAQAFQELFARLDPEPKVGCVYAGFNGENMPAKEWGVAYLRNSARFAEDMSIEHPADCTGDLGAALGPLMIALAALGIQGGYRRDACLVFCTSDREARAAAMVRAVGE